ncbi:MAG: hypothetical protein NC120_10205 [Ruminococcus sp.]|nr:hypothetical protein [Ruminococcus sp.]
MKTNKTGTISAAPKNNPLIREKNRRYMMKLISRIATAVMTVCMIAAMGVTAFAADVTNDAGSFDTVVSFIVTWVQRIGYVIGFIGAVQFGLAFKNDDADGKQRGLMTLASGFIVIAICIAYDQLFKSAV